MKARLLIGIVGDGELIMSVTAHEDVPVAFLLANLVQKMLDGGLTDKDQVGLIAVNSDFEVVGDTTAVIMAAEAQMKELEKAVEDANRGE